MGERRKREGMEGRREGGGAGICVCLCLWVEGALGGMGFVKEET